MDKDLLIEKIETLREEWRERVALDAADNHAFGVFQGLELALREVRVA